MPHTRDAWCSYQEECRADRKHLIRLFSAVVLVLAAWLLITEFAGNSAYAQSGGGEIIEEKNVDFHQIAVARNKSKTFRLRQSFDSAVVAEPEIADVLPISDTVLYVQGKKAGTTNISIFNTNKTLIGVLDVEVTIDTQNIARKIRETTRSPGIKVTSNNDRIILSGEARSAEDADRATSIAKGLEPDSPVVNLMRIAQSQQVLLKVRFLEASRESGRDLGFNWFATNDSGTRGVNTGIGGPSSVGQSTGALGIFQTLGTFSGTASTAPFGVALANLANSGANVDVLITALETKGLARRLAEPDLVALSGDKASFLAGGEIPVPVVQPASGAAPSITVEYKPFGVQLTFVPTVLDDGLINLRLTPSVSQLDFTNAIRNQGFLIPALTKREARTTIELRDGQSFAIAGLLQREGLRDIAQVPWLGSVPVLGTLFRSSAYQQSETDLVVIVTPHLVAPAAPGERLATPFDKRLPSNDRDFFLGGKTEVRKKYSKYVTSGGDLEGPYGHMISFEQHPPDSPFKD